MNQEYMGCQTKVALLCLTLPHTMIVTILTHSCLTLSHPETDKETSVSH